MKFPQLLMYQVCKLPFSDLEVSWFLIGVRLLLYNGSTVSNNSIVDFDDLPIGVALLCSTDRKIGFNASWASPAGNQATAIFNVNSGASVLQMERTASPIQAHHNGIWHCEIPDFSYDIQYIYVGLYSQGKTLHLYDNYYSHAVIAAYTM